MVSGECHPSGTVVVDGKTHSARSENSIFIEAGAEVEILRQEFGELIVRPAAARDEPADRHQR